MKKSKNKMAFSIVASGFGKSTVLNVNITWRCNLGLNLENYFIITATSKPLPFKGSGKSYKIMNPDNPPTVENGNRLVSNNGLL